VAQEVAQRMPWDVEDDLWHEVRPLLPVVRRAPGRAGRRRLDDRRALCGVLFVLVTGVRWELLPQDLGYGSGVTCWRRVRDWQRAGTWPAVVDLLTRRLAADAIDWHRIAGTARRPAEEIEMAF
jgi:transposase